MSFLRARGLGMLALLLASSGCQTNDVILLDLPVQTGGTPSEGGTGGSPSEGGTAGVSGSPIVPESGAAGVGGASVPLGGSPALGGAGATAAGGGPLDGRPCKSDVDCEDSYRCVRDECGAATGTCEATPVFCATEPGPVCGCNGVTYWNECIARQAGVFTTTPGECLGQASIACRDASECGVDGAYCARLHQRGDPGDGCDPTRRGTCWVMPPACPTEPDPMRWAECPPPPLGQAPICVSTCAAIVSERPWVRLPDRIPCQW